MRDCSLVSSPALPIINKASQPASQGAAQKGDLHSHFTLNKNTHSLQSFPSFLETMKQHQHLLALCLMFLLAVAAAAVAVEPQPQPQQVQDQQQMRMRMSSRARSLLQAPIDCPSSCNVRCGNNWKNEMCNEKCVACCHKCGCVPPGTSQETRHLCPCYDTMVNPHNPKKLKCP